MTAALGILVPGLVLALLERSSRLRFRPLPDLRPYVASDVVYLLTGYVAGASLALAWIAVASAALGRLGVPRLAALGLPRGVAVALALVALDAGNYLAHWLLHRVDALWELHKVHHSSRALDWLATFRSHLLEQILRRLLAPLLLILGGFPIDAVALAGGLFTAWAAVNHSNLRLDLRFLEAVVVTPRLHRLHHLPRTTERNLGTLLTLWDRLRGTLVVEDTEPEASFGLPAGADDYPQGWLRQLVEPVAGQRSRSAAARSGLTSAIARRSASKWKAKIERSSTGQSAGGIGMTKLKIEGP